jgi:hypothetical protein
LAYCKNRWWKDHKEVTGKQTGRKKGVPRLRWMDDVKLDLRSMVVKIWRTRTLGRTEWTFVMRQAEVKPKGL